MARSVDHQQRRLEVLAAARRVIVRDGIEGLLVPPGDAPALADALVRLCNDPAEVATFGAAARARIEAGGFTEAAVTDRVCAVWRDLLDA